MVNYVGVFYKLRRKLPLVCLKNVYFTFIHSHILYGVEKYGPALASHLEKLSNLIIRYCEFCNRSHVGELYKTFGTLPVSDLYELQIAKFVHKVFRHYFEVPTVFNAYFVTNDELHDDNTRHKDNIHGYAIKTTNGLRMIRYKGPAIWNNLPVYRKEAGSVCTFRKNA
jgi:hypothetical protein